MELALRTTAVLGLAFLVAATLRRATPATRHLLWHVTLAVIVLAPALQGLTPRIVLPASLTSATFVSARLAGDAGFGTALSDTASLGAAKAAPSRVVERAPSAAHSIPVGGHRFSGAKMAAPVSPLAIWVAGSFLVGAWFALGWLASLVIARRTTPAPGALEHEMRAVSRDLRVTPIPRLRLMPSSRGPLTVGLFRPVILLPAIAMVWDADRRRAILAHELAHVRRADTRTQALAHLACALYWFNPLVWMAARALRRERERACDDEVVGIGVRPSTYAQDLLDIARVMSTRFSPSAAIAMARRSELEGRLRSILAPERRRTPARISRWALPATMGLVAVVSLGGQPGTAQTVHANAIAEADDPPAPSLFYSGERQREARQRARNDADAATLWQSRDEDARERAAASLALSGDVSAIGSLIAALDDPSGKVREKAAIGLGLHSAPEVVEPLIRALEDRDAQVREKAAAGLMLRRDPRVIDALLIAITDSNGPVREKAAIALGTSGDRRTAAALERATHDADAQVREKAVAGLALLGVVR